MVEAVQAGGSIWDDGSIVVVGVGALGSLVAARLALAGADVTVLGRPSAHLARVREWGLTLVEADGRARLVPLQITDDPAVAWGAGLAVVAVKTWATAAALPPLRAHLPPTAAVLTLQNGLGNAAAIRAALGDARRPVLVGVTTQAALREAPGRVRDTGPGETVLGPDGSGTKGDQTDGAAERVARRLTAAGWPTVAVTDIGPHLWRKLAVNAAINPLTALAGVPNRAVADDPDLRAAAATLAGEVATVAAGLGLDLGDVAAEMDRVARATGANRSSMLRDLEAGGSTEVDAINGAVVAEAVRLGLAAPANRLVAALVRARAGAARPDDVRNLAPGVPRW